MEGPKYPDVTVNLSGESGNAFYIIGAVRKALRRNGVSEQEIVHFTSEAKSSDYDNVITTAMRWVSVE